MGKVAKKYSEVKIEKVEKRYCGPGKSFKQARKAYTRALRQHNRNVCRLAA